MTACAIEVADVFRRFGPQFVARSGASLSGGQRKVIQAIEQCRGVATVSWTGQALIWTSLMFRIHSVSRSQETNEFLCSCSIGRRQRFLLSLGRSRHKHPSRVHA